MKLERHETMQYRARLTTDDGTIYLLSERSDGALLIASGETGQCLQIKPLGEGSIILQQY